MAIHKQDSAAPNIAAEAAATRENIAVRYTLIAVRKAHNVQRKAFI